jgi:hypothetical protein
MTHGGARGRDRKKGEELGIKVPSLYSIEEDGRSTERITQICGGDGRFP